MSCFACPKALLFVLCLYSLFLTFYNTYVMNNPFGTVKDVYKLKKEAEKMQEKMKKILAIGESKKSLVKLTLNGAQELVDINFDDQILGDKVELKKHIKDAYGDAQKKLQKEMAKGMDMDKLKEMLGGM